MAANFDGRFRWQVVVSFTFCMTLGFNELRIDGVTTMPAYLIYREPSYLEERLT
jgi:hypothetical protein